MSLVTWLRARGLPANDPWSGRAARELRDPFIWRDRFRTPPSRADARPAFGLAPVLPDGTIGGAPLPPLNGAAWAWSDTETTADSPGQANARERIRRRGRLAEVDRSPHRALGLATLRNRPGGLDLADAPRYLPDAPSGRRGAYEDLGRVATGDLKRDATRAPLSTKQTLAGVAQAPLEAPPAPRSAGERMIFLVAALGLTVLVLRGRG